MKTRFLATIFALLAIATTAQAQFGGGDGSQGNPYIISTTDHMTELANNVNGGNDYRYVYFRLEDDLDYSGKTYTIIADYNINANSWFLGKFNGNGHTISGVTLDRTQNGHNSVTVGLFGTICFDALIENLTLSASTIKGRIFVGGIVGEMKDFTTSLGTRTVVRNCHVTSDVTIETVNMPVEGSSGWQLSGSVGGIVGGINCEYDIVENCTSAANILASSRSTEVGGIAGRCSYGVISGCVYTGTISGGAGLVGGILGNNYENGATLSNNYVGGNCTLGAVGVSGSTQGTDAGYDVTHLHTIGFNNAQYVSGTIATQPTMTIGGTDYYASGSTVTLSSLSTFGSPTAGNIWSFRATVSHSYYEEIFRQEDGTWQFTMPMGNAIINPAITKDISLYTTSVTLTPASATYTGSSHKPTVSVTRSGVYLTEGTDFITDIPTAGYTNPGDYTFHIWGIGQYGGMRTETFTVSPAALTQLTLSETSVYYDGAAHTPTLTVKSGSKTLTLGTEYETDLPSGGFTDLGNYTLKAWGVGNYTDTVTATFTICHPWDGMGTENEPFLIQNEDDMDRLATLVNGGKSYNGVYFRQEDDFDFTGRTYTPVGNADNRPFEGTYNGNARTMTGINVNQGNYVGVFGHIGSQGTVFALSFAGTNSFSGSYVAGSIAGWNFGTIDWCYVQVGANVSVTAGDYGGGIAGANYGTINQCDNRANVTANCAGGIAGLNSNNATITGGRNYATVTGIATCGGIVGENESGTITGQHEGSVNCTNNSGRCGGIVGFNFPQGVVEYCHSNDLMTAVVEGFTKGAIVGRNDGTLTSNYYFGACKFEGIGNVNNNVSTDVTGQAMRGWPISHDERIDFHPMPDASDNIIGTYYYDGTNNYYYVGAGETLRFILNGGSGYTANGTALVVAGHDDYRNEDYYELTMPAAPVHIAPTVLMLTLYDNWVNNHNIDDITDALGETRSVVIEGRTLYKTGIWNTICLPFALADFSGTPLEDATVKELASSSYNASTQTLTLNFSTVSEIEAGKPYIVKWASGENIENPVFENVVIGSATASSAETDFIDFVGCYSIESLTAQDRTVLYMGGDSKLYYPGSDMKVNAFRGFFRLKDGLTAGDLPNSAKAIVLDFGDETTSLNEELRMKSEESVGDWYSIDGRKLNGKPTAKGIYIIKGKKVVIK